MAISRLYFDTLKFTEDTLENRKFNAFVCSAAVYSEILKDNVLTKRWAVPLDSEYIYQELKSTFSSLTVSSIGKEGNVLKAKSSF